MDNQHYSDWTGLTSGHTRPPEILEAKEEMESYWRTFSDFVDMWEDGVATREDVETARKLAQEAEKHYHELLDAYLNV